MNAPSEQFRLGYCPALDGIRGIAILLVLLYHFHAPVPSGFVGVDVFFVLSGFLITALLGRELEGTGRIDLLAFYRRRALRLLPALALLLILLVGVTTLVRSPYRAQALRESLIALLYSMNWFKAYGLIPENNYLGHTWSLCIEEQYYLLWPLLLLGLHRAGASRRAKMAAVAVGLLASTAVRIWLWTGWHDYARVYHGFDTRADGLLTGCLVALAMSSGRTSTLGPRALRVAAGSGLAVVIALSVLPLEAGTYFLVGIPLANLAAAGLLVGLLAGPDAGVLQRLLEWKPLVWIGRLSYGLYLYHTLVPHLILKLRIDGRPWTMPLEIALSFALATASYYGLERRFLKRKSPRHADAPPA